MEEIDVPITMECTEIILKQMKECLCKIKNKKSKGTGFFCIISDKQNKKYNVLITNNQVINDEIIKENDNITVSFNNDKEKKNIKLDDNRKIYTSEKYGITIIEIKKEDNINNYLDLDDYIMSDILDDNDKTQKLIDKTIYNSVSKRRIICIIWSIDWYI